MMEISQYYGINPLEIGFIKTNKLSMMYSCMISNKAMDRIRRIEEINSPNMKDEARNKFINGIFKEIDDKFKDPHMVDEDELIRILGNGGK